MSRAATDAWAPETARDATVWAPTPAMLSEKALSRKPVHPVAALEVVQVAVAPATNSATTATVPAIANTATALPCVSIVREREKQTKDLKPYQKGGNCYVERQYVLMD